MAGTQLELLRDGEVVRVVRVGTAPVHVGRHLDNTLVLADEDVSGHHAVVVASPTGPLVRDLRSTNGTFVNGVRVADEAPLRDGDEVRLGAACLLRVREAVEVGDTPLALTDLTAGTVHPLAGERVYVGSKPGSHVELAKGPPRAATLTVHPGGEVWLDTPEEARPVALGEVFEVAGHALRIDPAAARTRTTLTEFAPARFPYTIEASLDGPGGPSATLRDPREGTAHTVTAETRATLLFVLARRRREDLVAGIREDAAGWMDDEDVLVAVWGRGAERQAASGWSVLLHRLRRELEAAGFEPSFLEKRRGAVRLRLDTVTLT
ncbi:MAG: FHA domain-containing protein [Myxococcota bacterium]